MSAHVDESAKLEVLEALGEALGLESNEVGTAPENVRPAAEALLRMSSGLWEQATLIRGEPMGQVTLAGLHPVLRALVGMDEVVWETIGRLRPKYLSAVRGKNATVVEFILKSTSVALSAREDVPVHSVASRGKQRAGLGEEEERDAREAAAEFYRNYVKYRPERLRTQADVAAAAGISVGTVAGIEKMKAKPHHGTVAKIARAFGVGVEEMVRRG